VVSDETKDSKLNWKDGVAIFALRVVDSGLIPWVLVATFCLGLVHSMTRNLNSSDTLTLINRLTESKIFAFGGWLLSIIQIPVFVFILNRTKRLGRKRLDNLETENSKARELLKKMRQSELKLEQ
jgi:hypothetical protein